MKFAWFFTGGVVPGTVRGERVIVPDANKRVDALDVVALKINSVALTPTAAELNTLAGILATQAELDAVADDSARVIAAGATLAVTVALHNKRIIGLDTLAGSVCTLPAATSIVGARFRFRTKVLATSNSHIVKVANASDTMEGIIQGVRVDSGNAVLAFAAGATADTITLNRTTTGSVSLGEEFEVECVADNKWQVRGMLSATGAAFATPFSATV